MPQPAENDVLAESLIGVYREAQERLEAALEEAVRDPSAFRRRRRIRELLAAHEEEMGRIAAATRSWWSETVPAIYAAGATDFAGVLTGAGLPSVGFSWSTPIHSAAVEQFATRTWTDVAARLLDIDEETRKAIRGLARSSTRSVLLESLTATDGGRQMAREAAKRGLWSVRYSDGSRHTMRDYADTVIRTTTATAYNEGAVAQAQVEGIEQIQYADGPDCGVTSHHDPVKANGLIVPLDDVVPLSHPRCRRALLPVPFGVPLAGADLTVGPERAPEPETVPRREPRGSRSPRASRSPRSTT
jgi:hypothetical protein